MSERVDRFCNDLRDKLNAIEDRLERVKGSIQNASNDTRDAVEAKKRELETAVEAEEQKVAAAKAQAENWFEQKKGETEAKIEEWRVNREVHKLEKRADDAESYAVTAIVIAAAAVDEADLAILEAVAARLIADEAVALTS